MSVEIKFDDEFDEVQEESKILEYVNSLDDVNEEYQIWNDGEITIIKENNMPETIEQPLDIKGRFLSFPYQHQEYLSFAVVRLKEAQEIRNRLISFFNNVSTNKSAIEMLITRYNKQSYV